MTNPFARMFENKDFFLYLAAVCFSVTILAIISSNPLTIVLAPLNGACTILNFGIWVKSIMSDNNSPEKML